MPVFIFAIFLSAFLLFQVQPIIARYILPWYGGSPAVWTTCMLCFQVGLLGGYFYAHVLVSKLREKPSLQVLIHVGVLLVSCLLLPIAPDEDLKPKDPSNPIGGIVWLVMTTVGLPYLVISASGPLLQSWFGLASGGKSPYRLYAVSNLGSLLGLISYPFLFEPKFGLNEQTDIWSGGYGFYGVLLALCGWVLWKKCGPKASGKEEKSETRGEPKKPRDRLLWVLFPACGSVALLALTNQMCQDIAVVPFLWVLPLSLYLTTFIIAFDAPRWYLRFFWLPLLVVSVGGLVWLINQDFDNLGIHIVWQVSIYCAALFCCCMVCHGEMVRLKPDPHFLTSFYLAVSLGGALGGLFVSFVAPAIFDGYHELHVVLLVIFLAVVGVVVRDLMVKYRHAGSAIIFCIAAFIALAFLSAGLWKHVAIQNKDTIDMRRGFYGVLIVHEDESYADEPYRQLYHGRISHGRQYFTEELENEPITYYGEGSGPDTVFDHHPSRTDVPRKPMKYGVVGLGVGTMAAFAEAGDTARFYEINSQVEDIAREYFTYLENCQGNADIVLGDARIMLEQELASDNNQQFDALFVDAFSGDSIPIHLLTEEAFALYFEHLKDDGVLCIHITNWHLDLSDPIRVVAKKFGYEARYAQDQGESYYSNYSEWVVISKNQSFLGAAEAADRIEGWRRQKPKPIHWTDDYSNLVDVVMWDELRETLEGLNPFSKDEESK